MKHLEAFVASCNQICPQHEQPLEDKNPSLAFRGKTEFTVYTGARVSDTICTPPMRESFWSAGNSLATPPANLSPTAPPPSDAPSVAWGVRHPRGSRATRVVGGADPPPK